MADLDIIVRAQNQSYENIMKTYELLVESIRQYLSRMLMFHDENNPLDCNFIISTSEDCGLSELEKPTVISMYQMSGEGIIYLKFEGDNDYIELDELEVEIQLSILEAIENS
jgi:hypothetical protein